MNLMLYIQINSSPNIYWWCSHTQFTFSCIWNDNTAQEAVLDPDIDIWRYNVIFRSLCRSNLRRIEYRVIYVDIQHRSGLLVKDTELFPAQTFSETFWHNNWITKIDYYHKNDIEKEKTYACLHSVIRKEYP